MGIAEISLPSSITVPASGLFNTDNHIEGCRLAGTVRTEKSYYAALLYADAYSVNNVTGIIKIFTRLSVVITKTLPSAS